MHSLAFMDTCDFLFEVQSFCLQQTYEELKLSQKKHLPSHKKQSNSTLRAMDSSCVFQKTVCQQEFQKLSSVCRLVCLARFRCLQTVNLSVQSTGCLVPTSSRNLSLLRYNTVLYSLMISSVHSLHSSIPSVPRKSFLTSSKSKKEESSVPTVHMAAYLYPIFLGLA